MKLLIDVGTSQEATDAVAGLILSRLGRDVSDYLDGWVKAQQREGKTTIIRLTDDEVNCGYEDTYTDGWEGYTWVNFSELFFNPALLATTKRVKLNDEYSAEVSADKRTVTVGCQTIPASAVFRLVELLK